jgi:hypothetical protein
MGRVAVEATIENLKDLYAVQLGLLKPEQARRAVVADALADTGVTMLSLPNGLIRQLGLTKTGRRRINSSLGLGEADVYERLDFVVDPQGRRLLGNPAHGGEHIIEAF